MELLLIGAFLGLVIGYWQLRHARHEAEGNAEEKQRLLQEKQLVIDFVHGLVAALGEGASRESLLQRIVHGAILNTGALSACLFARTERGTLRGVAVEGLFPPVRPIPAAVREKAGSRARFFELVMQPEEFPLDEGVIGGVAGSGRPLLIANATQDPRLVDHGDPALRVQSLVAAPVLFQGELLAVLCLVNPGDGQPFSESDRSLVGALAEQAAMALHYQELLQFQIEKRQLDLDLALARNIQQMLLPRAAPRIPGLSLDARYRAAQQVGGDFYDLIPLPGGRLGVGMADVSGKGIAASLLMAICRTNLRQLAQRIDSPAAVLSALNEAMVGEIRQEMFITMIYVVIDPGRDEICFARAGHERPLLLRNAGHGGTASYLDSEGMPVGMVPPELFDPVLEEHRVAFAPGDLFVLYTDGLTEAPNDAGAEFSGERLADAVRDLGAAPPAALNDGILERVVRFAGREQLRDDLTLVSIRRD